LRRRSWRTKRWAAKPRPSSPGRTRRIVLFARASPRQRPESDDRYLLR
jgi:hypothetical protein